VEEEVRSGTRAVDRQNDALSAVLDNPEHTGRVRGVGVNSGWKEVFNGPAPRRKSRTKVDREELVAEIRAKYDAKMADMEVRLLSRMSSMTHAPSDPPSPTSPGIRRSSQASGTYHDYLDNLKVITTCFHNLGRQYFILKIKLLAHICRIPHHATSFCGTVHFL